MRRLVGGVGAAEAGVGEAVVGHVEQDAGGGGDAGEGAGEHADEGADVDERAEEGDAGEGGEDAEGSVGFAEVLMELAEAEGFGVAADEEEEAGEDGGLDDGAGDGAERVAGFVAEGGGGLEADEAEDGEHDAEADAGGGRGARVSWGGRSGSRCGQRSVAMTMAIRETEMASIQSMRRAETWTSR